MQKIDPTVQKETKYIAAVVIVLSAAMEAVFLVLGKWNYTVLLGNALGALADHGFTTRIAPAPRRSAP